MHLGMWLKLVLKKKMKLDLKYLSNYSFSLSLGLWAFAGSLFVDNLDLEYVDLFNEYSKTKFYLLLISTLIAFAFGMTGLYFSSVDQDFKK